MGRLSATSLAKHATQLTQFIGGPKWSESSAWQPFMADLCALTEGMETLAAAMAKNATAVEMARQRTVPARTPDCEKNADGSDYKLCCAAGECHTKYEHLRGCVFCSPPPPLPPPPSCCPPGNNKGTNILF